MIHTPGPWTAHVGGMDAFVKCPDGRRFDCGDLVYHPENASNARLVAAAPELLDACKAVLEVVEFAGYGGGNKSIEQQHQTMLRNLIAKAEGMLP